MAAVVAPMPSHIKIQIQKCSKSPRVLARGRRNSLAGSTGFLLEHDRPNDTRPDRDRSSLPTSVIHRVPPSFVQLGISLPFNGIGNSRTRQVSLTSTLLSCIQRFSRSTDDGSGDVAGRWELTTAAAECVSEVVSFRIREREDRVFGFFFWLSSGLSLSPGGSGGRSGRP